MEVCDTCGCLLVVGDTTHRVEEHYTGKQHLGYAKVKATIEELLVNAFLTYSTLMIASLTLSAPQRREVAATRRRSKAV